MSNLAGSAKAYTETKSSYKKKRYVMPWKAAAKGAGKFALVGAVAFGTLLCLATNVLLLGKIILGGSAIFGLVAFVRYCTPKT